MFYRDKFKGKFNIADSKIQRKNIKFSFQGFFQRKADL